MGIDAQASMAYLIDFGLSKQYRNPSTYEHIPPNTGLGLIGTATFASINSHLGLELGRRDDMESLAYVLIYFLRGRLPWQDLRRAKSIMKRKQEMTLHKLCRGLPAEFLSFLEHCRSLSFEEIPDYEYISNLFTDPPLREGLTVFDWESLDNEQPQNNSPEA
jgi:serine/threonine protein kinase